MFSICGSSLVDYEKAGKNRERIMKLYPFITKYDWYGINLSSKKDYLVKFEKNNLTVAFNLLYEKEKEIYPAYISKYNSTCEKKNQTANDSLWKRLAVSCSNKPAWKWSGITSLDHSDFLVWIVFNPL